MYKFLIPLFALALLIGCSRSPETSMPNDQTSGEESTEQVAENPLGFNGDLLTGTHTVTLKTSLGDVTIEIDADRAPKTATNFVVLSQMGFYNGLTFHRVIPGFMIQGGDPNGDGTGGASIFGETFEDEPNDLPMQRGMLAMANRGPDTNGSQFFIITAEATPWLQGRHTVFGKVVEGMDIVDAIAAVERDASDRPVTPVTFDAMVLE